MDRLVDGRHDGGGHFFGSREVIAEGRGDGVVGLLRGVRIAREAQGPVVVGELDAQGARGVEVTDRVGPGQQVPGVDQVGGAAEGGDLCKDSVDGGLQGDLQQVAEVSAVAFWRVRISVSCPSRRASWRACPAW